jgi:hypothetical protein
VGPRRQWKKNGQVGRVGQMGAPAAMRAEDMKI